MEDGDDEFASDGLSEIGSILEEAFCFFEVDEGDVEVGLVEGGDFDFGVVVELGDDEGEGLFYRRGGTLVADEFEELGVGVGNLLS